MPATIQLAGMARSYGCTIYISTHFHIPLEILTAGHLS